MNSHGEEELARAICKCPELDKIRQGQESRCRKVVTWQDDKFRTDGSVPSQINQIRHLPEPWTGSLSTAKIMFLSSNPSFDASERFPNSTWDESDVVEFMIRRFVDKGSRSFGALEGPTKADQDRTIRHGEGSGITYGEKVRTWSMVRKWTATILGMKPEQVRPSRDYVMTEVVHCKSRHEKGVDEALSTCVDRWLERVFLLCPARLVVVSGRHAGAAVKSAVTELSRSQAAIPEDWGSWKGWNGKDPATGLWPTSGRERDAWVEDGRWNVSSQGTHTCDVRLQIAGESRQYTFVWLPHATSSVPRRIDDEMLISTTLLERWRRAANGGKRL